MNFQEATELLRRYQISAKRAELAHLEVAPYRNAQFNKVKPDHRKAGVLVHLYPKQDETFITLIKRPEYDGKHSGQIAFPGGKWEKEDQSMVETALREAWEETNIEKNNVEILGHLSDVYIPPSNFKVTPVIGLSPIQPNYIPDEIEVDQILEVKLNDVLSQRQLQKTKIKLSSGINFETPYFELQSHVVWGATAMMLNELKHYFLDEMGNSTF